MDYVSPPIPPPPPVELKWRTAMWVIFGVLSFLIVLSWVLLHMPDKLKARVIAMQQASSPNVESTTQAL